MEDNQQTHSQALPIGYRVGDYIFERVLGQGGFGITYLARDRDDGSQVVIKENLPRDFAFRETTSRQVLPADASRGGRDDFEWALGNFYNEAQLLASLDHPNIVKVVRAFHALGTAYYVMPYVGGSSLDKWAEQHGAPDLDTVVRLLSALLSALGYLHGNNILHRDIKPQNILMTQEGEPVLIDFGTARQIISERSHTQVGSPGYTPFEQIQSHGKRGPWTDFYALGATMYRIITGKTPADCKDRMGDIDDDPLVPLTKQPELVNRYGKPLLSSIDKAMELKIRSRWQTSEEWLSELGRINPPTPVADEIPQNANQNPKLDGAETGISGSQGNPAPVVADTGDSADKSKKKWGLVLVLIFVCIAASLTFYIMQDEDADDPVVIRKAADQGDAKAQYKLGLCYENGRGVSQDYTEAAKWYRKAADQGHADAQCALGFCYANGWGVSQDYTEAAKWCRKAANQGNAIAQCAIGWCYDNGKGVTKDDTEAVKWYRQAADQGHAGAQYNLGVCYANGRGVSQDDTEAVKWYRKAADQGLARAQNNLGECYEKGQGVTKDDTEAVKWYRKAADQGYAGAQFNLGVYYAVGNGVPQNHSEAAKWYRKAADQGDAYAQYLLGVCYEKGQGVTKDDTEAVKWYRKAAEQEHESAKRTLRRLGQ